MRLRFEDCVLDTDIRQLTREGTEVQLSPKAFRLLEVLAERRPRAVSHDELRRLVWPEATAGGTTIARVVNEVRTAIGDQARPAPLIRTVQRFGYAFSVPGVADPAPTTPASRCAVQWGAQLIALAPGENVIGRAADAAVSIPLRDVSRRHALIRVADGQAVLEDLGSKHGTLVGKRPISGPVPLRHGDEIQVGPVLLIFRDSTGEEPTF